MLVFKLYQGNQTKILKIEGSTNLPSGEMVFLPQVLEVPGKSLFPVKLYLP